MGRRVLGRILAVAVWVAGCGGNSVGRVTTRDPPTPAADAGSQRGSDGGADREVTSDGGSIESKSGSRLTVAPYSSVFPTVKDEVRGVVCLPRLAADGATRCLPDGNGGVVFTDSDCKYPVVRSSPDSCGKLPPYFVEAGGPGGCLTPSASTFTAGAQIQIPTDEYRHSLGLCSPNGSVPLQPGEAYYEAVPSDRADWVALEEETIPVTDALAVTMWKGADGSRIPGGFRLLPSGEPCEQWVPTSTLSEPPTYCIPRLRAQRGSEYADDQCKGPNLAAACAPIDVAENVGRLFETGARISQVYFPNPFAASECQPLLTLSPSDHSVFYSFGPAVPPDRYPLMTLSRSGAGRIQTEYLTSAGKNLVATSLYDTQYAEECTAVELATGGSWCMPGSAVRFYEFVTSAFSDVNCTREIRVGGGIGNVGFGLLYPKGSACDEKLLPTLYSAIPLNGLTYEWSDPAVGPRRCVLSSGFPSRSQLFEAGAPIDPATVLATIPGSM